MSELRTHRAINAALCGRVLQAGPTVAVVELHLTEEMTADARGLVHGGFIFGAADFAAMAAVNDPNVVLGSANVRFLKPACTGETLRFEAHVESCAGRKHAVAVVGRNAAGAQVFDGTFACVVLEHHVLDA